MEELYSETYLKAKPSPKRTAVRWGLIFLCLFLVVFDLIINGERRKHKKRIDMEKVELVAPEEAPVLYNSRNLPMEDYSSRMPGDKHYIAAW